jgi:hypothetical protein
MGEAYHESDRPEESGRIVACAHVKLGVLVLHVRKGDRCGGAHVRVVE